MRIAILLVSLIGLTACSGSMKDMMDGISKLDPFAKTDPAKKDAPKKAAPAPKAAPKPAAQPTLMGNPLGSFGKLKTTQTTTTKTSSAHCCVNGAYYTCPSGAAATQCLGQPMRLMSCIQGCGFKSGCDQECARNHGPNPSACQRNPSKDSTCRKR